MSTPSRPSRIFRANDILTGRVVLDGYPFAYVVVLPATSMSSLVGTAAISPVKEHTMIDEVLTAVEFLESRGWELVGLDQGFAACMRRIRQGSP